MKVLIVMSYVFHLLIQVWVPYIALIKKNGVYSGSGSSIVVKLAETYKLFHLHSLSESNEAL